MNKENCTLKLVDEIILLQVLVCTETTINAPEIWSKNIDTFHY